MMMMMMINDTESEKIKVLYLVEKVLFIIHSTTQTGRDCEMLKDITGLNR